MLYIGDYLAFWVFTVIFIVFLTLAIFIARIIGPIKRNPTKGTIYECGQSPFGRAMDFKITGITRYFGYAVVFFALDAFSWVVLTAAMSLTFSIERVTIVSVYTFIVLVGIGYFLSELGKMVR